MAKTSAHRYINSMLQVKLRMGRGYSVVMDQAKTAMYMVHRFKIEQVATPLMKRLLDNGIVYEQNGKVFVSKAKLDQSVSKSRGDECWITVRDARFSPRRQARRAINRFVQPF